MLVRRTKRKGPTEGRGEPGAGPSSTAEGARAFDLPALVCPVLLEEPDERFGCEHARHAASCPRLDLGDGVARLDAHLREAALVTATVRALRSTLLQPSACASPRRVPRLASGREQRSAHVRHDWRHGAPRLHTWTMPWPLGSVDARLGCSWRDQRCAGRWRFPMIFQPKGRSARPGECEEERSTPASAGSSGNDGNVGVLAARGHMDSAAHVPDAFVPAESGSVAVAAAGDRAMLMIRRVRLATTAVGPRRSVSRGERRRPKGRSKAGQLHAERVERNGDGWRARARTWSLLIQSQAFCQLNYPPQQLRSLPLAPVLDASQILRREHPTRR